MVSERRLVCEESQDAEEEDEQTDRIAKLSPTNPYATDMFQKWVQIWHTLGVDEIDINEVILLAVNCYLPDWQGEAVHNWLPSDPRPLRGVWEGTVAGQGQLRLRVSHRGSLIPAQHRNTHQLREAFKWCPVSGEYGRTQCGVTAITAAYTCLSRRKVTMGTQKAGRRTWIMRDPKEGTARYAEL